MLDIFFSICPPNNSTFTCVQAYKTIAPPLFSVQNWLFALMVMGGVTALLLGIAAQSKIGIISSSFIYLIFIGMLIGSLIDLALNIVSFVFPLFIFLGFAIYIWRSRS